MELHRRRTGLVAELIPGAIGAALVLAALTRLAGVDRRVPEALLIVAVLVAAASHRPLRESLAEFDRRHQLAAAGLFVALFLGQFMGGKGFPFVSWRMYGSVAGGQPSVYEYDGVRADGTVVALVPSRLLNGITANRFANKLAIQIDQLRKAPDPKVRGEHEASVVALARRYNDGRQRAPIESVDVSRIVPPAETGDVLWRITIP